MKNRDKGFLNVCLFFLSVLVVLGGRMDYATASQSRYIDEVGILSLSEAQEIRARLDQVSEAHRFDVVIAVIRDLDYRQAHRYAVDLFEDRGFGYGNSEDGAILLLAMEGRDLGFAALGSGLTVFTSEGQEYLDKLFLSDLQEDRYYQAFLAFTNAADDFLTMAEAVRPYDSGNIPLLDWERRNYRLIAVGASLLIALVVAFVTAQIAKDQLKSIWQQHFAHGYIREGSMNLQTSRDVFLYRNLRRERREEKEAGGTSFTTSSGRKATGHSKKF